ncbi:hypothetical protein [Rhabdochromatium marinum]|uniref:hypothetical protein n=1 Tax=Rhabdochromatium marinum TaxID=48729 RepID=UPI001904505A|nr:hypothetical protein [Rhabdochromatium marinum]MBK1649954.1 hypothetical protein [Rhabdochromatium marinum]
MPRYSEERRAAVVAKLLPPQNLSPHAVAEQKGSLATVYKWRTEARAKGAVPTRCQCPGRRAVVLEGSLVVPR